MPALLLPALPSPCARRSPAGSGDAPARALSLAPPHWRRGTVLCSSSAPSLPSQFSLFATLSPTAHPPSAPLSLPPAPLRNFNAPSASPEALGPAGGGGGGRVRQQLEGQQSGGHSNVEGGGGALHPQALHSASSRAASQTSIFKARVECGAQHLPSQRCRRHRVLALRTNRMFSEPRSTISTAWHDLQRSLETTLKTPMSPGLLSLPDGVLEQVLVLASASGEQRADRMRCSSSSAGLPTATASRSRRRPLLAGAAPLRWCASACASWSTARC